MAFRFPIFIRMLLRQLDKPWPLPPGAVYPERLRDTFAELRMHPADVTEAAILPWIPRAAEIDQEKDKGLMSFCQDFVGELLHP